VSWSAGGALIAGAAVVFAVTTNPRQRIFAIAFAVIVLLQLLVVWLVERLKTERNLHAARVANMAALLSQTALLAGAIAGTRGLAPEITVASAEVLSVFTWLAGVMPSPLASAECEGPQRNLHRRGIPADRRTALVTVFFVAIEAVVLAAIYLSALISVSSGVALLIGVGFLTLVIIFTRNASSAPPRRDGNFSNKRRSRGDG